MFQSHFIKVGPIILALFVLAIMGIQILFFPFIDLAHGLGYDGIWYHNPSLHFLGKVDNYHLFRILPSKLAFLARHFLGLDDSISTTARIFQVENLVLVMLTILVLFKIAAIKGFSNVKTLVFFVFCLCNFSVFKEFTFNPVMTDALGFFLSSLILWFHLKKENTGLILTLVLALFCMPIIPVFYLLWLLLQSIHSKETDKTYLPIFDQYFYLIPIAVGVLFVSISLVIVVYFGRISVYTFPDEINFTIFPLTLLVNFFALWLIIGRFKAFFLKGFFIAFRPIKILRNKWFFVLISLLIFQTVASKINNYYMLGYSGLFVGYPVLLNLKPLIGLVDNLSFYGPVLFLFLIQFFLFSKDEQRPVHQDFLYLIVFLIILKPEARHTLFLIPLLSVTLLEAMPDAWFTARFSFIITALGLIFSKFWYPVHWAHFPPPHLLFAPETNQKIYQEFPVQHYFMFQGPMMAHGPYFVILSVILITAFLLWKELKKAPVAQ